MDSQGWQQIEELYNAVLARTPEERSTLLDQADPDLRREVELMLAQKGSLMDRPAWEALPEDIVTMLAAGHRLGRYEIEARLDAGGMGEVFRARDTRLNRTVALKVSKIQFSERFEREARAIAQLNHPHICTLYDVGPNYLVMELVEGTTLSARMAKGALPMAEVLHYGAQIAEALTAAHDKGIVHRDLKPGNIMLAKRWQSAREPWTPNAGDKSRTCTTRCWPASRRSVSLRSIRPTRCGARWNKCYAIA